MTISAAVLLVASLLAAGALAPPVAERVRLPVSLIYALMGLALSFAGLMAAGGGVSTFFTAPPVTSEFFLYVLLPILLFHGALGVDIRRMREDALPISLLALLAVVVAIVGIGLVLWPISQMPLMACFLLASMVATTDPVAVISIFRGVGAPERLTRLLQGESLFNDAAAVAFFLAFTALIVRPGSLDALHFAESLVLTPLGGGLVGCAAAFALLRLPRRLLEDRVAFASISLAVPLLVFWVAEVALHVSGVLAVVAVGVALATAAPGRVAPAAWRYAEDVWELVGNAATVLIFVLTASLAPQLMAGWALRDFAVLVALCLAALGARAAILLWLFPFMTRLGTMPDVPRAYRLVALWGGLRGSMTLVLALSITENSAISPEVRSSVAMLATGFTFFTLFVQGPSLRPLIQRLGLDQLTGVDRALRDLTFAATRRRSAERARPLIERLGGTASEPDNDLDGPAIRVLPSADLLASGLAAITGRERQIVFERLDLSLVEPRTARRLLAASRRRLDLSRFAGAEGYAEADAHEVAFGVLDRLSIWLQRTVGLSGPLARRLAARFEAITESALVVDGLGSFIQGDLASFLGRDIADQVEALRADRAARLDREIVALRLQYPAYAADLARLIAARVGRAQEVDDIRRLARVGVINPEVERALEQDLSHRAADVRGAPELDLGLDTRALIDACLLFDALSPAQKSELASFLKPYFAAPGDRLIVRGSRGTEAFFLSSGAVEVDTGTRLVRLGRGEVFGEMALLFDVARQADVTAIAYSSLLRLSDADFNRYLARHPRLEAKVREVGFQRLAANAALRAQSGS